MTGDNLFADFWIFFQKRKEGVAVRLNPEARFFNIDDAIAEEWRRTNEDHIGICQCNQNSTDPGVCILAKMRLNVGFKERQIVGHDFRAGYKWVFVCRCGN